jgi:hypothetical protein
VHRDSGGSGGLLDELRGDSSGWSELVRDDLADGSAQPVVSSINPIQGGVVANAAIVPAGTSGQISVFPNTGMHLYGDINGYFSDDLNAGNLFIVNTNQAAWGAIVGINSSSGDLSSGLFGRANAPTGRTFGVWGERFRRRPRELASSASPPPHPGCP